MQRFGLLAIYALMLSSSAHAEVYKWQDAEGRTHFGDQKPATTPAETLNLPTSPTTNSSPATNSEDYKERQRKLLDAMTSEREAKELAAQKQAEQQAKQQKSCVEMKDYLRNISSGRIYILDNKGERKYANDAEQTKEVQRIQQMINQSCR